MTFEDTKDLARISNEFTAVPFYKDVFLIRRHLFRDLRDAVGPLSGGRWLDVGCGIKPYATLFNGADFYVGIDHPSLMEGHYGVETLSDVWGEAGALPFRSRGFDGILSIYVIEHLPDPALHLSEIHRVLVSGGRLILSAPFVWPLHDEPWDFFRFTSYGLIRLVESAGFRVEEVKAQGGSWSAVGQMIIVSLLFGALLPKAPWGRLVGWFWKVSLVPIINVGALLLDKLFPENRWTISFLIVARKSEGE